MCLTSLVSSYYMATYLNVVACYSSSHVEIRGKLRNLPIIKNQTAVLNSSIPCPRAIHLVLFHHLYSYYFEEEVKLR